MHSSFCVSLLGEQQEEELVMGVAGSLRLGPLLYTLHLDSLHLGKVKLFPPYCGSYSSETLSANLKAHIQETR